MTFQHLKPQQVTHELGLKGPFQNLLDKAVKKRGWTLVSQLPTHSGGKRVVPDGTVRDGFRLARSWWEAKDTPDNLAAELTFRPRMNRRSISTQRRIRQASKPSAS